MSVNVERPAGAALLHPLAVVCLLVLVVNDHVLKRVCPGLLSGKLSDFSGVLLLPLFLHAAFELLHEALRRRPPPARVSNRALAVAALVTVVGFALPELGEPGAAAYRHGLGALQWPFRASFAALRGHGLPALVAVQATADLTDLAALPMALVAYALGRRRLPMERPRRSSWRLRALFTGAASVAVVASTSTARAAEPRGARTHDGFFLNLELGAGPGFLNSTASISNGFRQSIPSSARGMAFPMGALELGGTLHGLGLVLGGRLGLAELIEPVIHTLGERFRISGFKLRLFEVQAIARWYPDPGRGLHFGLGLGGMSVTREDSFGGEAQRGLCAALEGGHDFWIAPQWSLGVSARLTTGQMRGDALGKTTLVLPALSAALTFH